MSALTQQPTRPPTDTPPGRRWDKARITDAMAENGFVVIFAIWVAYLTFATDTFLTQDNISVVLRQAAVIGIVAIGETIVMLMAGIDISLGSILAICGVVAGKLLVEQGVHPLVAGLAAVLLGLGIGAVNGLVVTKLRINSVIATLGMLGILEGLAFIFSGGRTLYGPQIDRMAFLSKGYIASVPFPVILLVLFYVAAWILLTKTTFGARVYAVGNNERAGFLAGISVDGVKIGAFAVAGALAGFGGLMQVSRLGSAQGGMGQEFLFPVLTAVVLGGVSLQGGKGKVQNTAIAAVFLTAVANGLILLDVSGYTQRIVSGVILIVALSLDRLRRNL